MSRVFDEYDEYEYLDPPKCSHDYEYFREGYKTIGRCTRCGFRIDATRPAAKESQS